MPVFKPLQVCGDASAPGGFLSDIPWIVPSPLLPAIVEIRNRRPDVPCDACRDSFAAPLYRPPRISPFGA